MPSSSIQQQTMRVEFVIPLHNAIYRETFELRAADCFHRHLHLCVSENFSPPLPRISINKRDELINTFI